MMTNVQSPSNPLTAVGPAKKGESGNGIENLQNFLIRYGYLEGGRYEADTLDDETSVALVKYQERNGLPATGDFDEATREVATMSRCGLPDLSGGIDFATQCAWTKWSLTYSFDVATSDCVGEFQAVRNAFATWAAAVPLTFTEISSGTPDIRIGWRPANDPDHSMVGGVLAHADFPPGCSIITNTVPKPVHFDDSEHTWCIGAVAGQFDVETVALHELGHIIGLGHSSVTAAVMAPTVSANFTKRTLTADDTSGANTLYPSQGDWRWCNKCQGLFFGGNAGSVCPKDNGTHSQVGSGYYILAHNMTTLPGWQSDWRWCNKCQGLFFGGNPGSVCPKGGGHDKTGSGKYSLPHNAATAAGQQSNWRWCGKCQGLFFGGNAGSVCPKDKQAHTQVGSGNYSLIHR